VFAVFLRSAVLVLAVVLAVVLLLLALVWGVPLPTLVQHNPARQTRTAQT